MRPELKRIETILQQVGTVNTASYPKPTATRKAHAAQTRRTYSFKICSTAQNSNFPTQQLSNETEPTSGEGTLLSSTVPTQKLAAKRGAHKEPTLPNFRPNHNSYRNRSNPASKLNLLPETTMDSAACEAQLQQIVLQIQDTYHEGPIVNGWLESYPRTSEAKAVTLRCESVEHLSSYVKEVFSFDQGKVTCESPCAGYRLCGLDTAGQKWSWPCPIEQLPSVSIAIARYQKLQQLLERKHYLETRLAES